MEARSGMDFLKSLAFDKSKPGFFALLASESYGDQTKFPT